MTHKWNYLPITSDQAEASQRLAQELGISPVLGRLLVERGITTATAAKKFFRPQLPDLYDPFLMKDMDVAVERLNKAMGKKERILIYGDYDVDGTTAVALVYKFIQQFLHTRPLQRGIWRFDTRCGLCLRNRCRTDYRAGLRHQSRR